jgi:PAS domain S-box-containing protein
MTAIVGWYEAIIGALPLTLLEVWGRFAYIVGLFLAICAFGGFTFRIGERWGFGRARQTWDAKAFLSLPLTAVLIIATGYIGSFIVLVPGAQTFESLKDLTVLLCIVLFGYPALIVVPFAYGVSDLIEGVPPEFLLAWLPGYFINPSCFWIAHQFFGKNPDFRLPKTWGRYLASAVLFLALEPALWGYQCSEQFPGGISYRAITPALFFTTSVTWLMGPFAFLVALPLARRLGWFWAEIPGHVRERAIASREWSWESGRGKTSDDAGPLQDGVPIRIFVFTPFIALVLVMVGATAIIALRSADDDALMLATRLHQQVAASISMQLDDYLARASLASAQNDAKLVSLLQGQAIGTKGRAFIRDISGKTIASSAPDGDAIVGSALEALAKYTGSPGHAAAAGEFQFDHVTAKPLSRETWLAHATPYRDDTAGRHWVLVTAMPEAFYLAGLRVANSRSAMVFAVALVLSLVLAALLASMVTAPIRRMANATQALARGDLNVRVPDSKLGELGALTATFNDMTARLKKSFDDLVGEVEMRKRRERELQESEARLRMSEERWRLVFETSTLGIMLIDHNYKFVAANRALQVMVGYSAQELLELSPVDLMMEDEREAGRRRMTDLRDGKLANYEVVARYRRKDGRPIWANTFVSTVPGGENREPVFLATAIDVTEQRKAQSDLADAQAELAHVARLTTMGELAASIAHEISQPLSGVTTSANAALRWLSHVPPNVEKAGDSVKVIVSASRHASEVIDRIRSFLKHRRPERAKLDINDAIRAVLELTGGALRNRQVTIQTDLPAGLPSALGDWVQLQQVIMNLIMNGADAMAAVTDRPRVLRIWSQTDGAGSLMVGVEDSGIGIDAAIQDRIFEPLFTTKSTGMGMGLSICRSIVESHGGKLWAVPATPHGTEFRFTIPTAVPSA